MTPDTFAAIPFPMRVPRPQGTRPPAPLAAFVKLAEVMGKLAGMAVRLAAAEKPEVVLAVITIDPAVAPAVTLVVTWPCALLVALSGFTVAVPVVPEKDTTTPATGFGGVLLSTTMKVRGVVKAWVTAAV